MPPTGRCRSGVWSLVTEGLDGVEVGGAACRIPAEEEAHGGAYREGGEDGAHVEGEGQLLDEGGGKGIDAEAQEDAKQAAYESGRADALAQETVIETVSEAVDTTPEEENAAPAE